MIHAKNYEPVFKFVKVMPRKLVASFFWTRCSCCLFFTEVVLRVNQYDFCDQKYFCQCSFHFTAFSGLTPLAEKNVCLKNSWGGG